MPSITLAYHATQLWLQKTKVSIIEYLFMMVWKGVKYQWRTQEKISYNACKFN